MIKVITWSPMPNVPHGELGCVETRRGRLRIAAVINEACNPRRPAGVVNNHRKPFTLELYVPLPVGTDKVQKYASAAEAKSKAVAVLALFVQEVSCSSKP